MEPREFVRKWKRANLKERSAAQEHFIDLCRLLGEPTPAETDPTGDRFCFEKGARKESGGKGWADVWKRHHFAWEYKGRKANLDAALQQLRQYAPALENPPLLIVSDMSRILIRTNWTNSVSTVHAIGLDDLGDASVRQTLKWAFSDPERLRPEQTRTALTEKAAAYFATLAHALREAGHDAQQVARFVNRIVFCLFAEDAGLLPDRLFSKLLQAAGRHPGKFQDFAQQLFGAMTTGGWVGIAEVSWFNGGIFDDDRALPLTRDQVGILAGVAELDWSEIDASILGTLFERGLDPDKRSQLGAHYTDRNKIMQIIGPVVVRPWQSAWHSTKSQAEASAKTAAAAKTSRTKRRHQRKAEELVANFLRQLRSFTVLDPACGSGNFLYLALQSLKDLEHRVQLEAETLGFQRSFPEIGPRNVKGIEINPFAAELARVSVWIGEIQWMRRNGFSEERDPILKPLETIECRDAVLAADGGMAEWPEADVVVGNPPFLGYSPMRNGLGDEYTDRLRAAYKDALPPFADLVCYWFYKAGEQVADGSIKRAGLVATNSIRGGLNRRVLDQIASQSRIFDAWADEPWILDGAAVRVSLVCFGPSDEDLPVLLNGEKVTRINSDLTADPADLTTAKRLLENRSVAFVGAMKKAKFDIPGSLAREWLALPANPNGRPNSDVLRPWRNGRDITSRSRDMWVVDFGHKMREEDAAYYEAPFAYAKEHVYPVRRQNNRDDLRTLWWRHDRSGQTMLQRIARLNRYIATPRVAKHRVFAWLDARIYPDGQIVVIARQDDATFGILHSKYHEQWTLRLCTWLGKGNDPRYTPTTTFETFPFPDGITPDLPASAYAQHSRAEKISAAARKLAEARDRWLYPPEWAEWVSEDVPGFPERAIPRTLFSDEELKSRTLTNLYNVRPQWLDDLHRRLDEAVAAAYGWPADIGDEEAMGALLELNRLRASSACSAR